MRATGNQIIRCSYENSKVTNSRHQKTKCTGLLAVLGWGRGWRVGKEGVDYTLPFCADDNFFRLHTYCMSHNRWRTTLVPRTRFTNSNTWFHTGGIYIYTYSVQSLLEIVNTWCVCDRRRQNESKMNCSVSIR